MDASGWSRDAQDAAEAADPARRPPAERSVSALQLVFVIAAPFVLTVVAFTLVMMLWFEAGVPPYLLFAVPLVPFVTIYVLRRLYGR